MTLALDGIRILDMAWLGPGPFCSFMLGDLGADVIHIYEAHPERRGGPVLMLFDPSRPGLRNCRTMGLDLKSAEGKQVFKDMVKTSDVEIIDMRLGKGLAGKSYVIVTGTVQNVRSAMDAALESVRDRGVLISSGVIPSVSPELIPHLV